MTPALAGMVVGGLAAAGLLVAVSASPPMRRPRLEDRVAPYLRDGPRTSRLLRVAPRPVTPFPTLERLLRPVLREAVGVLDRAVGGGASVQRRLARAGRDTTLEQFRAEQVLWGAAGLLAGIAASVLLAARASVSPVPLLGLCLLAAVGGVLARDRALSRQVRRREERMAAEFPTVAELLALAVTAGEGAAGALDRVSRACTGELATELRRAVTDTRAGTPLVTALDRVAARTALPALARFVEATSVAVERGTPLAEVLRAQAADAREAGKRQLLETGGRKEIAMLLPVVFLVLPVTIVFLVFPGFYGLSFTVH